MRDDANIFGCDSVEDRRGMGESRIRCGLAGGRYRRPTAGKLIEIYNLTMHSQVAKRGSQGPVFEPRAAVKNQASRAFAFNVDECRAGLGLDQSFEWSMQGRTPKHKPRLERQQ